MFRSGLLTLLVSATICLPAKSQFEAGMKMPGISIGSGFFTSGKIEYTSPPPTAGYTSNTNTVGVDISPSLGWFINSNTVVGGRVLAGYKYEKYLDEADNVSFRKKEDRSYTVGLGVFARSYLSTSGSFLPFGQLSLDGGIGSSKTEGYNYVSNYKETFNGKSSGDFFGRAGLSLGVTKLLSDHVGIDLSAGYTYSYDQQEFRVDSQRDIDLDGTIDETGVSNLKSKSTTHGFTISAGLQVFLPKRKK